MNMKTFIVLQKIVSFRVNWHTLYNPYSYQLVLIVHEPTLSKLAEDQKSCFAQIHPLAHFNEKSLQDLIQNFKPISFWWKESREDQRFKQKERDRKFKSWTTMISHKAHESGKSNNPKPKSHVKYNQKTEPKIS